MRTKPVENAMDKLNDTVGMKPLSERDENSTAWVHVNPKRSKTVGMKPLSERDENLCINDHKKLP